MSMTVAARALADGEMVAPWCTYGTVSRREINIAHSTDQPEIFSMDGLSMNSKSLEYLNLIPLFERTLAYPDIK